MGKCELPSIADLLGTENLFFIIPHLVEAPILVDLRPMTTKVPLFTAQLCLMQERANHTCRRALQQRTKPRVWFVFTLLLSKE
jgi:hypothetical protein